MLRQLEQRAARSWTGALCFRVPGVAAESTAYLFEGQVYALDLSWYRPRVAARLASAGIVDATRQAIIESALGRDADQAEAGRFCVEQGWLSAERLGAIHGEFVLAGLGGALPAAQDVRAVDGAVTGSFCTLPIAIADLEATLRLREERDAAAWSFPWPPDAVTVERAVPHVEAGHQVPEVLALLAVLERPLALDELAGACGFTRAEASYIVSALAAQGVLGVGPGVPLAVAQVPEAVPAGAALVGGRS